MFSGQRNERMGSSLRVVFFAAREKLYRGNPMSVGI
jgi:hypothetical protein